MPLREIIVNDKMQKNYRYLRREPAGQNFELGFQPELSPPKMLFLGVFGGKYLRDCIKEFPSTWFTRAKLAPGNKYVPELNYFKIRASQTLKYWEQKGWINKNHDPRGWFQWYCRYYTGRRIPGYDQWQIKRWCNIKRHKAQLLKACAVKDLSCRPRQRQALLHWAYDSREI